MRQSRVGERNGRQGGSAVRQARATTHTEARCIQQQPACKQANRHARNAGRGMLTRSASASVRRHVSRRGLAGGGARVGQARRGAHLGRRGLRLNRNRKAVSCWLGPAESEQHEKAPQAEEAVHTRRKPRQSQTAEQTRPLKVEAQTAETSERKIQTNGGRHATHSLSKSNGNLNDETKEQTPAPAVRAWRRRSTTSGRRRRTGPARAPRTCVRQ